MALFKRRTFQDLEEKKQGIPEGLWVKCPGCTEMLFEENLGKTNHVCPHCGHHIMLGAKDRIHLVADEGSFEECDTNLLSVNALEFAGYTKKVQTYKDRTGLDEAVITGRARIGGMPVSLGAMDFRFLGASMGSVVGEKITRCFERATEEGRGIVLFSASGGARMHEGILSLMQMAKTSAALHRHAEAGLPFISVLTHPTTGGVTASFATLGDIILAEPKTMIGFAGPRVIKDTTHQDLPEGFQTAEFMMDHGLIDEIVSRDEMRDALISFLSYMMPSDRKGSKQSA